MTILYIARDNKGQWGLALEVDPPEGSQFKRYELGSNVASEIAKAYELISQFSSRKKSWDEVQLPDKLSK